MNTTEKKEEEPKSTINIKYCKVIAFVALVLAIGLIAYVLFAPSSPVKIAGGKSRGWGKKGMRGGCGCAGTPPPS